MKFITGGAYQGKKDFVINYFNISEKDIYDGNILQTGDHIKTIIKVYQRI